MVRTAAIESKGSASDCHRWADGRLGVSCRRRSEFLFNLHSIYTVQVEIKKFYRTRNPLRMKAAPTIDSRLIQRPDRESVWEIRTRCFPSPAPATRTKQSAICVTASCPPGGNRCWREARWCPFSQSPSATRRSQPGRRRATRGRVHRGRARRDTRASQPWHGARGAGRAGRLRAGRDDGAEPRDVARIVRVWACPCARPGLDLACSLSWLLERLSRCFHGLSRWSSAASTSARGRSCSPS